MTIKYKHLNYTKEFSDKYACTVFGKYREKFPGRYQPVGCTHMLLHPEGLLGIQGPCVTMSKRTEIIAKLADSDQTVPLPGTHTQFWEQRKSD